MSTVPAPRYVWPRAILIVLAVLCFLLAVFHAAVPVVDVVPLGLAFGFAAFLPWW